WRRRFSVVLGQVFDECRYLVCREGSSVTAAHFFNGCSPLRLCQWRLSRNVVSRMTEKTSGVHEVAPCARFEPRNLAREFPFIPGLSKACGGQATNRQIGPKPNSRCRSIFLSPRDYDIGS